ncbi:hypothetical protein PU629_02785 [Pullulanibacillus sp. KACC 23026]|uniref:spr1630 family ClpXP-sensitive toxin n=1 Tax=Pullulanibacillus sp. KACC 23026 TaxID=3028315 RepID=UPI0023B03EF6|nr:hypothetical protein [Pullulanibacillus sp. KACC 23026]WEG13309.1 hypothetical protein PU629_02785 [Pullulanibacillus sp. KACC 23026]
MKQYRFSRELNQSIVNGILNGYKSYVEERNEKRRTMKISDAYAWVKGNHIDDQTAIECEDIGILYKKARAGYTWGYLQFSSSDNKSMFIIKNAKYFNPDNFPGGKTIHGEHIQTRDHETYLKKLSRINENVEFPEEYSLFDESHEFEMLSIFDDQVLKSLEDDEVTQLQKEYSKFYIVTYEIDEAFLISKIQLWMPNPVNNIAYLVEDLSELIGESNVNLAELDTTVLNNDIYDYDDSITAIDFGIAIDDETKKSKKDGQG